MSSIFKLKNYHLIHIECLRDLISFLESHAWYCIFKNNKFSTVLCGNSTMEYVPVFSYAGDIYDYRMWHHRENVKVGELVIVNKLVCCHTWENAVPYA